MFKLDQLDKKILFELDLNSRQSLSALARKLKQTRDRIEYRVKRLEASNVIERPVLMVDVYRLGFTFYKTYLRLENHGERASELIRFLKRHPRVYWLALCDGTWDLAILFCATHAKDFQALHDELLSRFNDIVLNFTSYVITEIKAYGRAYLAPGRGGVSYVGSIPEPRAIDETDSAILGALGSRCDLSIPDLSTKVEIAPHVIRYRLEQLENDGVIAGYRLDLNLSEIGVLKFKTQLFLRNYNLELRRKFLEYCDNNPHIVLYVEQIGDCNLEIELEVVDYSEYSRIIDEIRSKFSKLIRNYNTLILRDILRHAIPGTVPKIAIE